MQTTTKRSITLGAAIAACITVFVLLEDERRLIKFVEQIETLQPTPGSYTVTLPMDGIYVLAPPHSTDVADAALVQFCGADAAKRIADYATMADIFRIFYVSTRGRVRMVEFRPPWFFGDRFLKQGRRGEVIKFNVDGRVLKEVE